MKELTPEFSHIVVVDKIPSKGRMFKLEASDEERNALKERLGLLEFHQFKADVKLIPMGRSSIYKLEGHIIADLAQPCVVSLAPVREKVDTFFEVRFAPERDEDVQEREFILSEQDDYEPLIDGVIDVAEMATQHLSLELDPYPRLGEAQLTDLQKDAAKQGRKFEVNAPKANPFSALSALKTEKK